MEFLTVFGTAAHSLTPLLHVIATAICILIAWPFMMTGFGPDKIIDRTPRFPIYIDLTI